MGFLKEDDEYLEIYQLFVEAKLEYAITEETKVLVDVLDNLYSTGVKIADEDSISFKSQYGNMKLTLKEFEDGLKLGGEGLRTLESFSLEECLEELQYTFDKDGDKKIKKVNFSLNIRLLVGCWKMLSVQGEYSPHPDH